MQGNVSITGLMVTGKNADRIKLARRAVDSWQQQYYLGERELLIINDHVDLRVFPGGAPYGVRELIVPKQQTLGDLRNLAIDNATHEYLVQWDDDDYSNPSRLLWQCEHTDACRGSILRYEIHYDQTTGDSFVNDGNSIRCRGFPGTMMWPRRSAIRFPRLAKREDVEFVLAFSKRVGIDVLTNDPTLYVRCYHGANTWSKTHVMHRKPGSRNMTATETSYLRWLQDRLQTIDDQYQTPA